MVIFLPFLLFSPLFILVDGILKTVVIVLLQPNPTYFFITKCNFQEKCMQQGVCTPNTKSIIYVAPSVAAIHLIVTVF